MAASRSIAMAIALVLASCAPAPTPAPVVVAPVPKQYSCDQQKQAAAEYDALPTGAMLRTMIDDYGTERKALRGAQGLPVPPDCPAGS